MKAGGIQTGGRGICPEAKEGRETETTYFMRFLIWNNASLIFEKVSYALYSTSLGKAS